MPAPDPSEAVAILTSLQRFFGASNNNSVPSAPSNPTSTALTAAHTSLLNPTNSLSHSAVFDGSNPAPPIQPYVSQREPVSLGHPAAAAMPSSTPALASMATSTTPFRDGHFRDLIPQVDRERRDGAARHRQNQNPPPLQRRTASSGRNQNQNQSQNQRTRGSAVPFPTLGRREPAPNIDDTLMTLPSGEQLLRLQVTIHLPDPNGGARVIHHITRANVVEAFRTKMDLQHQFQVPLDTSVGHLMTLVSSRLASSSHCYVLPEPVFDTLNRAEPQFLVLEFTNAGRRGSASNIVYMRTCRIDLQAKVADLTSSRHIAIPQWAIKEGYFQVHFLLDAPEVEARFSLAEAGLGTEEVVRRHVCLPERFHLPYYYGADQRIAVPSSETGVCDCLPDNEEEEVNLDLMDVSSDEGAQNEIEEVSPNPAMLVLLTDRCLKNLPVQRSSNRHRGPRSLTPAIQTRRRAHGTLPRDAASTSAVTRSSSSGLNAPSNAPRPSEAPALPETRLRGFGIPVSLFAVEYTLPDQIAPLSESVMEVRDLVKYVRNTVHPRRSAAPTTLITGINVEDAARNLLSKLEVCFKDRDFSSILSPNRFFEVGSLSSVTSTGDGVESEVVSVGWKLLSEDQHSYFFRMSSGDKCTLACSVPNAMSYTIPATRKNKLGVLGAMAALMITYGKYPYPLSPAFLQFIMHETNPLSLTPSFVSEWLPEINSVLNQFRDAGTQGDVSSFQPFFQSYTGLDANTLKDRTPEFHDTIASLMLYHSTISFEPPTHPEIQAFLSGFKLPGGENNFDFAKAIRRSFRGGSEALLSQISLSHISGPESVRDHVVVEVPSAALANRLSELFEEPFKFSSFLENFLTGIGVPCPDLWADLIPHLNECVQKRLEAVEQPYFRPQMFFWAATGSPEIRADLVDGTVQVVLADDSDEDYMDGTSTNDEHARLRRAMLDEGKMSFRTCAAVVRIPASYLEKLVRKCKSEGVPILPRVHHWLLSECLNAVGKHSMV
ncbi:hypothetical protein VKT23_007592 [Stygiomarasmius scandens]|uniref:HECT domain-containing protein n=1 Tax=Marasmiellus scandens TaxID=2682957 RepID=A0ABR1JME8_9AGAR